MHAVIGWFVFDLPERGLLCPQALLWYGIYFVYSGVEKWYIIENRPLMRTKKSRTPNYRTMRCNPRIMISTPPLQGKGKTKNTRSTSKTGTHNTSLDRSARVRSRALSAGRLSGRARARARAGLGGGRSRGRSRDRSNFSFNRRGVGRDEALHVAGDAGVPVGEFAAGGVLDQGGTSGGVGHELLGEGGRDGGGDHLSDRAGNLRDVFDIAGGEVGGRDEALDIGVRGTAG